MSEQPAELKIPIDQDQAAIEIADLRDIHSANGNLVYDENGIFIHALAPNGEKSRLGEAHWLFVRTAQFKNWFGDWQGDPESASKIIDSNGEPLLVWHEAPEEKDFEQFDDSKIGTTNDGGYYGRGHYFLNNRNTVVSGFYAGSKLIDYACFLNVRKLFREDRPELFEVTKAVFGNPNRDEAIEKGWAIMSQMGMGWKFDDVVDLYDEADSADGRFNGHEMHNSAGPLDEGVDEIVVKRAEDVLIVDKFYSETGRHISLKCLILQPSQS